MLLLSFIASALIAAAAGVAAHLAATECQRKTAMVAARVREIENEIRKRSNDDGILDRAMGLIEHSPRCPRCRGVVRAMGRFCPNCGENFARPLTVAARVTCYAVDEPTGEVDLRWQCLSCGGETRTQPDARHADTPQIVSLRCEHCDIDAGEVLIDPHSAAVPDPRPSGSLRLPLRANASASAIRAT
ncbi:MAG: hypothetical protein ACKVS9_12380 [Phycisphaerae bacterium]